MYTSSYCTISLIDAEKRLTANAACVKKFHQNLRNIAFCRNLDFVSIMTYDFHGAWDTNVEHHSPIYARQRDPNVVPGFNMVKHREKHYSELTEPAQFKLHK